MRFEVYCMTELQRCSMTTPGNTRSPDCWGPAGRRRRTTTAWWRPPWPGCGGAWAGGCGPGPAAGERTLHPAGHPGEAVFLAGLSLGLELGGRPDACDGRAALCQLPKQGPLVGPGDLHIPELPQGLPVPPSPGPAGCPGVQAVVIPGSSLTPSKKAAQLFFPI